MKTYKLHFIRHGITEANLQGIYCGTTDYPLCEEGLNGLNALMNDYQYPYVDVVYSSPLLRAMQTAMILFPNCEYIAVENLREASFGRFDGKKMADLKNDEEFQKWIVPGSDFTPAGVEPSKSFHVRCREGVIQVVDDMMRSGYTSAAIVTHASVISSSFQALAYPQLSGYDWSCEPGMGFTLRADPSLFIREPLLEYVGEVPFDESHSFDEQDPFDVYDE